MHLREILKVRTPPRNIGHTAGAPSRTHDRLGRMLAHVIHHLASSTVAEEVAATSAHPAPSAPVPPSGTSPLAPEHSRAGAAAVHSARVEAVAAVPLEELRVAALAAPASRTEHVLLVLPRGAVWQNREARLWLETQCRSGPR